MRTRLGWALCLLGVLVALGGAAIMAYLGPDSRISSGPHRIETDAVAAVTAPKVISWTDVTVDILVEVPVRKPVFVGIGNAVDVQSLVGTTKRVEMTGFQTPWKVTTRQVDGTRGLPGAPTALDWWIAQSSGLGGASISTTLPDETVSVAILSVGSSNLSGLEVTIAYGIKGGFAKGLAVVLLGAGLGWLGWLLARDRVFDDGAYDDEVADELEEDDDEVADELEEDVVYVLVDDDGTEHEISAEEAETYEVVDEVVEVVAVDESVDVEEVEPVEKPVAEPPVGEPPGADDEVVYVYVDEDGIEHEVGADQLDEFEVVDEEDET